MYLYYVKKMKYIFNKRIKVYYVTFYYSYFSSTDNINYTDNVHTSYNILCSYCTLFSFLFSIIVRILFIYVFLLYVCYCVVLSILCFIHSSFMCK